MSVRRLALTGAAMVLVALGLDVLTPGLHESADALVHAQATVDSHGADALVLPAAGLAAWAVWTWGALGLALTAVSALPGAVGGAAGRLLQVLLPAGARRSAALALGVGLGIAAPVQAGVPADGQRLDVAVATSFAAVPDWPLDDGAQVPDRPAGQSGEPHVVVPGDCLWNIAAARLRGPERPPTNAEILGAVHAWWSTNEHVVGPDPDLILPGQVLRPPQP